MFLPTCNRKKSKPRVNVKICEKCRHIRKCADYGSYIQPSLFLDLKGKTITREIYRRGVRPNRDESDYNNRRNELEQMVLELEKS